MGSNVNRDDDPLPWRSTTDTIQPSVVGWVSKCGAVRSMVGDGVKAELSKCL